MLKNIKKGLIATIPGVCWVAMSCVALAATCKVNGKEVPCGGTMKWGIGIFIFFGILILISVIFWLMMIIHAMSKPIEHKAIWVLLLLSTGVLGAIIYYFAIKRKFVSNMM